MKALRSQKQGTTLLIAVLLAATMLSVGLGVYQRTYKELYLASFWKQVQTAFAAADGGLECAVYWDTHQALAGASNATCFTVATGWNAALNASATFTVNAPTTCVTVDVVKNAAYPFTTIKARGYNSCNALNPRRVERALRFDY